MVIKYLRLSNRFYCNITTNIMDIKTFVFLDLETTGLPQYEFGATKITEISLIAAQADHIRLGVSPRVQNKLSLCFNPRRLIQTKAAEITGLDNELLEYQEEFSPNTVKLLENFLNIQYKPVCLVAHNGNRFDFPILRTEIARVHCEFPENIMCVDSLPMFREFYQDDIEKPIETATNESNIPIELMDGYDDFLCAVLDEMDEAEAKRQSAVEKIQIENETTPKRKDRKDNGDRGSILDDLPSKSNAKSSTNLDLYFNPPQKRTNNVTLKKPTVKKKLFSGVQFTLSSVYERVTNKVAVDAHRAESDANILLECSVAYANRFISYSNYHAIRLNDIPLIRVGKRIGI